MNARRYNYSTGKDETPTPATRRRPYTRAEQTWHVLVALLFIVYLAAALVLLVAAVNAGWIGL